MKYKNSHFFAVHLFISLLIKFDLWMTTFQLRHTTLCDIRVKFIRTNTVNGYFPTTTYCTAWQKEWNSFALTQWTTKNNLRISCGQKKYTPFSWVNTQIPARKLRLSDCLETPVCISYELNFTDLRIYFCYVTSVTSFPKFVDYVVHNEQRSRTRICEIIQCRELFDCIRFQRETKNI